MADRGIIFRFSAVNAAKNAMASVVNGLRKVGREQKNVQALQPSWNRGLNANRRAVQQLGFQLTDFAVQVGGGQSAMLAFTQQGGQMLQFFGPFGAILAALLAVFGSLAIAFTKSGRSLSELIGITGAVQSEFEGLIATVKSLKEPMIDVLNVIVNNLDTLLIAAGLVVLFFAGKWIGTMVSAAIQTGLFTTALIALRTALLRLGIPALVVAAAYLIERFLTLRQAVGSFGEAWTLVTELVDAAFGEMGLLAMSLVNVMRGVVNSIVAAFLRGFATIVESFGKMIADILLYSPILEAMGVNLSDILLPNGGGKFADSIRETAEGFQESALDYYKAATTGFNAATKTQAALKKIRDLLGEPIDVRDWFGGDKGVPDGDGGGGGGGGKGAVEKATEQAKKIQDAFKQTAKSISSSLSSSFKSLLDGTKNAGEVISDILGNIADRVIDLLMTPIFNTVAGGITSAIMGPMVSAGLGPAMMSAEGGGMTGAGARAGGLDGRGGRLAMLHPDETVTDHRKGGSVGGDSVTVNQYITTPDAESFKRSQRQIARQAKGILG